MRTITNTTFHELDRVTLEFPPQAKSQRLHLCHTSNFVMFTEGHMTSSPITVTDLYQASFLLSDTFGPHTELHFLNPSPEACVRRGGAGPCLKRLLK